MQNAQTRPSTQNDQTQERIAALAERRWSAEKVNAWYAEQAWPCGFNFLPSTAVNFVEMWDANTFDEATIDRELGWAKNIGFNTVRTNLQFILWQDDPRGLMDRVARFLEIAASHDIKTVLCFFDDCGFSGDATTLGPQPDPVPGVHNGRAAASPGRSVVQNRAMWPELKAYVDDFLNAFGKDPRILFWDLYNEPGNQMVFNEAGDQVPSDALEPAAFDLMLEVFGWARDAAPAHPITVGGWRIPHAWDTEDQALYENRIDQTAFSLSDLVSFHAYCGVERMNTIINLLRQFGRPLMCTEWMARSAGSRITETLPILHDARIGAWQWGLVRGKTQTHIPWPGVKQTIPDYDENTSEWFHDVFDTDGKPYSEEEVALIRGLTQLIE